MRQLRGAGALFDFSGADGTLFGMLISHWGAIVACGFSLALALACRAAETDASPDQRPGVSQLPSIAQLPDPFVMNDGAKVQTKQDWAKRRAELREMILGYEYGHVPPAGQVTATVEDSEQDADLHATVQRVMLHVGPEGKIPVHLVLTIPAGSGPFPVIVKGDLCWGRVKKDIVANVIGRGYVLAEFDRTDIAPDKNERSTGVYPLYPKEDWGALAAWAWGFGRTIDYLVTRPEVDAHRIVITGHSRGGKAALLAGALDERAALTVPNGSGAGGTGCFRVQGPHSEDIKAIVTHFPYWFKADFNQFIGHVDQLPFDQHEVRALIAPRALLTTDSLDDTWANPLGTQQSFLASREVFKFLGAENKIGMHFRHGPHDQKAEDWQALLDFADWQLKGKEPAQKFDTLPFPDAPKEFTWSAPAAKE